MKSKATRHHPLAATALFAAAVLAQPAAAQSSCDKPESGIVVPDGQTASEEEMLSTQLAVNEFLDRMNAYLECLDARMQELPEGEDGERARFINGARYTAALDEMQDLAEKFITQVRVFKLRSERPD
jgi:hypothetical protein